VARGASLALERLAGPQPPPARAAALAHARGAVALAGSDPRAALAALRRAASTWRDLEAPYEVARARELAGLACQALGDPEGAALERDAARAAYVRLGAADDLARLAMDGHGADERARHGLTVRELQVLRMVATGATNRAIADELVLSVRTVDRHVSNIFVKLGVSSRAAATAYAHEHRLL
jgi:DNA-binding NarL/FixJ family response regulator